MHCARCRTIAFSTGSLRSSARVTLGGAVSRRCGRGQATLPRGRTPFGVRAKRVANPADGVVAMNTTERNELMELSSRLRRRAKAKRAHAENLRDDAAEDRRRAEEIPARQVRLAYTPIGEFLGWPELEKKHKRLKKAARRRKREAKAVEAEAAELEAAAERATMQAARGC